MMALDYYRFQVSFLNEPSILSSCEATYESVAVASFLT